MIQKLVINNNGNTYDLIPRDQLFVNVFSGSIGDFTLDDKYHCCYKCNTNIVTTLKNSYKNTISMAIVNMLLFVEFGSGQSDTFTANVLLHLGKSDNITGTFDYVSDATRKTCATLGINFSFSSGTTYKTINDFMCKQIYSSYNSDITIKPLYLYSIKIINSNS